MSSTPLGEMGGIDSSSQVAKSFELFRKLDETAVIEASQVKTPGAERLHQERNLTARKTQTTVSTQELPRQTDASHPSLPALHHSQAKPKIKPLKERPPIEKGGLAGPRSPMEDARLIRTQRLISAMDSAPAKEKEAPVHHVSIAASSSHTKEIHKLSLKSLRRGAKARMQPQKNDYLTEVELPLFDKLIEDIAVKQRNFDEKKLTIHEEQYLRAFKENRQQLTLNPSGGSAFQEALQFTANNSLRTFLGEVAQGRVVPTPKRIQKELKQYNAAIDDLTLDTRAKNTLKFVGNSALGAIGKIDDLHNILEKQLLISVPQQTMKVEDFASHPFSAEALNSLLAANAKIGFQQVVQQKEIQVESSVKSDAYVIEHSVNAQKKLEDIAKGLGTLDRLAGLDPVRFRQELQDLNKASLEIVGAVESRGKKDWFANLFLLNASALQEYSQLMVNIREQGSGSTFQELKNFREKLTTLKSEIERKQEPRAQSSTHQSSKSENEIKIEKSVVNALDKMLEATHQALVERIK